MHLLFVKENLAWPRSSGHDVHCYHMMRALAELGHELSLVTLHRPAAEAIDGLPLAHREALADPVKPGVNGHGPLPISKLQERFRSYWGISPERVHRIGELAREWQADAVVVVGLNVLPYLGAVNGALRIWYAADEWAWHHMSLVHWFRPSTWANIKQAFVKGLYERSYRSLLDRVWVVSDADRRAMRWVAGVRRVDVLPNGVDADYYAPTEAEEQPHSCVFWGRLDFGPNIQALEWFCRRVWPQVRQQVPDARFQVYGFQPTAAVRSLVGSNGIEMIPDLPDLRPAIGRQQIVVLPFVSGGGIKNKLLEAASMGKAIVCSRRACGGLRTDAATPLVVARSAGQWTEALRSLWTDPARRRALGTAARQWVTEAHTWRATGRAAADGLITSLEERGAR
jgi:glycosyltransferase involved in cell wall biosynthesis